MTASKKASIDHLQDEFFCAVLSTPPPPPLRSTRHFQLFRPNEPLYCQRLAISQLLNKPQEFSKQVRTVLVDTQTVFDLCGRELYLRHSKQCCRWSYTPVNLSLSDKSCRMPTFFPAVLFIN